MEFKDIVGYEGVYRISDTGEVWRYERVVVSVITPSGFRKLPEAKLKPQVDSRGYLIHRVTYQGSKHFNLVIHREVAKAFLDNPDDLPQVNHIDGNKHNNCVWNLEWIDQQGNYAHAVEHGLWDRHGTNSNFNSKLDPEKVLLIVERARQGIPFRDICSEFNIHDNTVRLILKGKIWRRVTGL